MVVSNSHFFMSNFGLSMDFDALIPPIAPNFTPGSLMALPPHAQSLAMGGTPLSPLTGSMSLSGGNSRDPTMMSPSNKANLAAETEKNKLSGNPNKPNENSNLNTSTFNTSSAKNNRSSLSNIKSPIEDTSNINTTSTTLRQQQTPSPSSCTSPTNQNDLKDAKSSPGLFGGQSVTCSNDVINTKLPRCIGCSQIILDQFILRVAPDLEWHAHCLKCHHCMAPLDERQTCYLKDGKPFCKLDYIRLFSIRCGKCSLPFEKTDQVMRTSSKVYHVDCFSCNVCYKQLLPGDEYAIREDAIFCRDDMVDLLTSGAAANPRSDSNPLCSNSPASACMENPNSIPNMNSPQTPLSKYGSDPTTLRSSSANGNSSLSLINTAHEMDRDDKIIFSPDEKSPSCKDSSRGDKRCSKDGGNKPTRIRTVLNEKQLHTLRTCYNANPRPDALMREQLVEMTGLSPRVIRVWFQNKRCKDKKRSIAIKQMHQLQAEKNISGLNGVPLVAGSPMRHDPVTLDGGQFHYSPYGPLPGTGNPHNPHDLDAPYMMGFDNGPGSVLSDGLGSPGSDCSLSLSSD